MRKLVTITGLALMIAFSYPPVAAASQSPWITSEYHQGDFKLVSRGRAADILISPNDFKVVRIAAADLALDVERVL